MTHGAYPSQEFVEVIHGVEVRDPFRWLEDRKSGHTSQWIEEEQIRFEEYFRNLGPLDYLKTRVRTYLDFEMIDQIGLVRDRYFYRKRSIGQEHASLFVMTRANGLERVLVDASALGLFFSAGIHCVSEDGNLLAYEVKYGGEHSKAIHIVDVTTGKTLTCSIGRGFARGFAFAADGSGYYYCHEPLDPEQALAGYHSIRYHDFRNGEGHDSVLLTMPIGKHTKLLLRSSGTCISALYCHDSPGGSAVDFYTLEGDDNTWRCICKDASSPFGPFFHRDRLFLVHETGASNGEIREISTKDGHVIRTIVPEVDLAIDRCIVVGDRLLVTYIVGGDTVIDAWSLNGERLGRTALEPGHSWYVLPPHSFEATEIFLRRQTYLQAPTLHVYNVITGQMRSWNSAPLREFRSYDTNRVSYIANDGTSISMTIVGPTGIHLSGDQPVIMTAYGGFGTAVRPQFSAFVMTMLDLGFLFAVPEIRGGGEMGRAWHEAGRRHNRQTAFGDFIAAAEWLCEMSSQAHRKIAVFGGSNAGLLAAAVYTQRPDLFSAMICIAPILDMLRYHLFDRANAWESEYGTADNPEDFMRLVAYSPYHRVRDTVDYPPALFVCGDQDSRCNAAHARKMAARLRNRTGQTQPILIDHRRERGHSPAMPLSVKIEGIASRVCFLCHELSVSLEGLSS